MCRFTLYMGEPVSLASLITDPENSLINQSIHARERLEPLNGDGFGVAWYVKGHTVPARFRSVSPAWSNANLAELARVTSSSCVLAHVRAATQNLEVSEANCHPFRWGKYSFMHNGDIKRFSELRRTLVRGLSDESFDLVRGNTDSEHLFAVIVDELKKQQDSESCESMAMALRSAVEKIIELVGSRVERSHIYLNMVICDGQQAVATRFSTDPELIDSLYIHSGDKYICDDGVCKMLESEGVANAVLVSSEPLNSDPSWEAVPENHMALISSDLSLKFEPLP